MIKNLYYCRKCGSIDKSKFSEFRGIVCCACYGPGRTVSGCDDMPDDPCDCSLKKAVQSLTEQSNENTLAVALMFDKMNRLEQKLPDE